MRALTIRQPWLWLILAGQKPIENRTWPTRHRGTLWLYAAAKLDYDCPPDVARQLPDVRTLPLGALCGTVEVVDCVRLEDLPAELRAHWSAGGPWCWVLSDPRALSTPVACKGRLGLWEVPEEIAGLLPH